MSEPAMDAKETPRGKNPYGHAFRIHHLLASLGILVLLFTGLGLHLTARPDWSLTGGRFPEWMPTARFHMYHLVAAVVFFPSIIVVAAAFVRRTRLKRLGSPRRMTDLLLAGGGVLSLLTGLLLAFVVEGGGLVRALHLFLAVLMLAALVFHSILALKSGWKSILTVLHLWQSPAWGRVVLSFLLLLPACALVLNGFPGVPSGGILNISRIGTPQVDIEKLSWQDAVPLEIPLSNGAGFDGGRTLMTLRAFHDGTDLFMLAQWKDEKEDRVYMPWEKTADGWKWHVSDAKDETVHYEDKFSLLFPSEDDDTFRRLGCAAYCHLGGGHPYGIKASDEMVDVWHWKGCRTDPVDYVDDKYWHHLDMTRGDKGRYGDPKESGGYSKNFNKENTGPKSICLDPSAVFKGAIPVAAAVPATPENVAKLPVGTMIPGVVMGPVEGDRGDVWCRSKHHDGRWSLYIRRKLDTGSRFDVPFRPGARHAFGAAAFDRNAKRHSYNHRVYYMDLEP